MKTSPRSRKAASAASGDAALRDLSRAIEQRLGPIEYCRLKDVIPYAGNPRQHSEGLSGILCGRP